MSTEDEPFDLDRAWRLDDQVSIRPERFGALLYHFGTRRLSFLKSPVLLDVVRGLAGQPSARAACIQAGVGSAELPRFRAALAALAASHMLVPDARPGSPAQSTSPAQSKSPATNQGSP